VELLVSFSEEQVAELKHAYQVFGVPLSATPVAIKQSYRTLVKRWHPDFYTSGTQEHADATQMMKALNDSYALIQDAPLRYNIDAFREDYSAGRTEPKDPGYPKVDSIFKFSWVEFWVRFVIGAIWGALFGFRAGLGLYVGLNSSASSNAAFFACIIISTLAWGLIVATAGDKFWQEFFGRWWLWR
jgi:DnaJ-class molecular chaperone